MTTLEIENGILKDWDLPDELSIELEKIFNCLDTVLGNRGFINPDEENSVPAAIFCSWLDPTPLLEFFRPSYIYYEYVKERLVPRTRFLSFLCLSRSN